MTPRKGTGPTLDHAPTSQLLQLCGGYFLSYMATGILVKWYTEGLREPRLSDMAFLYNNTLGSSLLCVLAVLALGWLRLPVTRKRRWLGLTVPEETPFIVVSGICTAIIIPANTLLLTLPVSVMVAMVIMRGSVIVISRAVDACLTRQGLLQRPVHAEENWAVVFALLAVGTNVLLVPVGRMMRHYVPGTDALASSTSPQVGFEFLSSPLAVGVLGLYVVAYAVRLYWMNYFKLTRGEGARLDNRGYFAIEQITATTTLIVCGGGLIVATRALGWRDLRLVELSRAAAHPDISAVVSGVPYALVAFFSVFLFMLAGRTATFAGLANRISSLLGGITATLLLAAWFHLRPPGIAEWVSLVFIFVAIALLARVEALNASEASRSPLNKDAVAEFHLTDKSGSRLPLRPGRT